METPVRTSYKFGPFEANPVSGELLKWGQRVRLQEQPFRLLVILLENPGQVVTREDIQSRIWQGNTFGDFDSGLRVAVRKLREALGDDAENPHYVETVPKRGYRLLAPIVATEESANRIRETETTSTETEIGPGKKISSKWILACDIVLLAAVGTGVFLFFHHRGRALTEKDTVVLADFINLTGDPVFDGALRQGLAVQLEQSPFLSLVSDDRIQQTLRLMGRQADARLTPEIAQEICERMDSAAVLEGSIAQVGSQYLLDSQGGQLRQAGNRWRARKPRRATRTMYSMLWERQLRKFGTIWASR